MWWGFFLDKSITFSLAQWMIFQIFKETIAKNTVYRDFYLVHSLCNVHNNLTRLLIMNAMPNTTARPVPSPHCYNSVSPLVGCPNFHKMVMFFEQHINSVCFVMLLGEGRARGGVLISAPLSRGQKIWS